MESTAFVVFVLVACIGALTLGFLGVAWLFAEISGWHKLARAFPCTAPPAWTHRGETIRVNAIRFRRCCRVAVAEDALYLQAAAIVRFKSVRIPWSAISGFQPDNVYGRPAMRLHAGGIAIVVESALYAAMYPRLAGRA